MHQRLHKLSESYTSSKTRTEHRAPKETSFLAVQLSSCRFITRIERTPKQNKKISFSFTVGFVWEVESRNLESARIKSGGEEKQKKNRKVTREKNSKSKASCNNSGVIFGGKLIALTRSPKNDGITTSKSRS